MLGQREIAIIKFIQESETGFPPSVREIAAAVGLKSFATVHHYLVSLERKGFIERKPNCPRCIKVNKPVVSKFFKQCIKSMEQLV